MSADSFMNAICFNYKKDACRKRLAFKYRHDSCSSLWICSVLHYDTIWQRPHFNPHVCSSTEKNHKIRNWIPSFHFTASFSRPMFYCSSIFYHSFNILSLNTLIKQLHIFFWLLKPLKTKALRSFQTSETLTQRHSVASHETNPASHSVMSHFSLYMTDILGTRRIL